MSAEPLHPIKATGLHAAEPPAPVRGIARLEHRVRALGSAVSRFRTPILLAALALFLAGLVWAVRALDLSPDDLGLAYIALSGLVVVPLAFVNGAISMQVMARTAGVEIGFAQAFKINCVAQFAEFLPVPGGAIVRGGALIRGGSSAGSAGLHIIVNALLWVSSSAVAAGLVLGLATPLGLAIAGGGAIIFAASAFWLASQGGALLALAAIGIRLTGLAIGGARIFLAFLAIGVAAGFFEIYPYVFATLLGSASSIVPGGLGVSEFVAAALASLSAFSPEAAFLAVGLNRVIGFAISGFATTFITFTFRNDGSTEHG